MDGRKIIEGVKSESTRKLNPHLYGVQGSVGGGTPKPPALSPLAKRPRKHKGSSHCLVEVSIIALRRGEVDDDSLPLCSKPLRDIIAWYLGVDDADKRVRWRYAQCLTTAEPETLVRIELL